MRRAATDVRIAADWLADPRLGAFAARVIAAVGRQGHAAEAVKAFTRENPDLDAPFTPEKVLVNLYRDEAEALKAVVGGQ